MKVAVKLPGKHIEIKEFDGVYCCDCEKLILDEGRLSQQVELNILQDDYRLALLCDEEGLLRNLPLNFYVPMTDGKTIENIPIVGPVVFFRYKWENPFTQEMWDFKMEDLTDDDINWLSSCFDAD